MEMDEIERGWTVFTEDGKRAGDVVEVHGHYLVVSRGLLVVRDIFVPRYAVASAADGKVQLVIAEERLRQMGWTAPPPPPPPPADGPLPRLVPAYGAGDEAELPFESESAQPWIDPAPDTSVYVDAGDTDGSDVFGAGEAPQFYDDFEDLGIMFGSSVEVGGDVYLATRRLGDGPPIVLIHGWGVDARVWDYLTLDLPRDYTVVTYDGRGYGRSSAPWTGYDVAQAGRDLRIVLRTLDLRDATLVGLDTGAAAALHYALDGGRRAARLVLIAPAVSPAGARLAADQPAWLHAWGDELRRDRPGVAARVADLWAPGASPETRAWLRDSMLAAANHALAQGLDALAGLDAAYTLSDLALPITILHGEADPIVPLAMGQAIAAAVPDARLVVLDTPGHLPMIADPVRVAAEIRIAIAGNPGDTPAATE